MKRLLFFTLLLPAAVFGQGLRTEAINEIVDTPSYDPVDFADSIVTFVPSIDMPLNVPLTVDLPLEGVVTSVHKGDLPSVIVKRAQTMTRPLTRGIPVRLFLRRHPEVSSYYPIAITAVVDGEEQ